MGGLLLALNGDVLRWPFISDDFIFMLLNRTRGVKDLLGAFDVVQNYFRPVGRELYFFVLERCVGTNPGAFHLVNFALLLATHALLLRLAWRMAGARAAVLATTVYALQYLHRLQMAWVSCSQDLLATLFGVLAVGAHRGGRAAASGAWFFVALLAKESVAPLPLIVALWEAGSLAPGTGLYARALHAIRRSRALWFALFAWALLVIGVRTWKGAWASGQSGAVADVALRLDSLWEGFRAGLSALVYLDQPWSYMRESLGRVGVPWLAMILLAMISVLAYRWPARTVEAAPPQPTVAARDAVRLGAWWTVLGAVPPALAGHHFSAYYMSFAAVGFALLAGVLMASLRLPVVVLVFLTAAQLNVTANGVQNFRLTAHTEELPGVSYVTVARLRFEAQFLDSLHVALLRSPPPRGAAVYLSHAPKGVSFASAGGRAPKVWFDDPDLELTYITGYQPGTGDRPRRFLRFDDRTRGFVILPEPLVDGIVQTERLLELGQWAMARDTVLRTLALAQPRVHGLERVELLNDLGVVELRLGDRPAARAAWATAATEAPDHVGVRLNLTVLEAEAGNLSGALENVNEALRLEPDHPLGLLFMARLERQLGREAEAVATWQRLVNAHPAYADSVVRTFGKF